MYEIKYYRHNDKEPVIGYINSLAKMHKDLEIQRINNYIVELSKNGVNINKNFKNEATKPLGDGIFELRPGNNRILFIYCTCMTIVLLHGFTKTTKKTPKQEIDKAKKEKDDYEKRRI